MGCQILLLFFCFFVFFLYDLQMYLERVEKGSKKKKKRLHRQSDFGYHRNRQAISQLSKFNFLCFFHKGGAGREVNNLKRNTYTHTVRHITHVHHPLTSQKARGRATIIVLLSNSEHHLDLCNQQEASTCQREFLHNEANDFVFVFFWGGWGGCSGIAGSFGNI